MKIFQPPHSRQKDNGPSVISSVPFGNPKNFIYRLALLYMMAKTLVKKSQQRKALDLDDLTEKQSSFGASPLNKSVVTMEAR